MKKRLSLMVDIDGTLAEYQSPPVLSDGFSWKPGVHVPIGKPLPGAVDAMRRLHKHFDLIIFSTRTREEGEAWLQEQGIPYHRYVEKPLNFLIIDDRCHQFTGDWTETLKVIGTFKPWHNP